METSTSPDRTTRLLQWSLTLAIVIVLNLLFIHGVRLFVTEPHFEDFCTDRQVQEEYTTKDSCLVMGGQWFERDTATPRNGTPRPIAPKPLGELREEHSYCNPHFTCAKEFDTANQEYKRNFFLMLVAGGLVAFLVGIYGALGAAVSLGFTWGGVISFIIASIIYWADMNEYLRFLLLLIVLIVLVWLGVKRLRDK